eukprot:TRINITY_DN71_c0_g2_i1.p1 TRINITY_DN71_c0_g2~~TRINITY_DN71_c0_g2_i1.p1  ORF type:complete len:1096 (+),score=218.72 TRINITY_DN71_c0_g2_i1:104-3391(+)
MSSTPIPVSPSTRARRASASNLWVPSPSPTPVHPHCAHSPGSPGIIPPPTVPPPPLPPPVQPPPPSQSPGLATPRGMHVPSHPPPPPPAHSPVAPSLVDLDAVLDRVDKETHELDQYRDQLKDLAKVPKKVLLPVTARYMEEVMPISGQIRELCMSTGDHSDGETRDSLLHCATLIHNMLTGWEKLQRNVGVEIENAPMSFPEMDTMQLNESKKHSEKLKAEYTVARKKQVDQQDIDQIFGDAEIAAAELNTKLEAIQKKRTALFCRFAFRLTQQFTNFAEECQKVFKSAEADLQRLATCTQDTDETIRKQNIFRQGNLLIKQGGWKEFFFVLQDTSLIRYKGREITDVMNIATMLARPYVPAKPQSGTGMDDRMFEVISPSPNRKAKPLRFVATTSVDRDLWIEAFQKAVAFSLASVTASPSSHSFVAATSADKAAAAAAATAATAQSEQVQKLLKSIPGNSFCADCDANAPDWASINLGVLLCAECSGVHRSLGVAVSKVRSLNLDVKVWEPELLAFMKAVGNELSNSVYEKTLPPNQKIAAKCDRASRENYIAAKYKERKWVEKPSAVVLLQKLHETVSKSSSDNIRELVGVLAAYQDWEKTSPLTKVAEKGNLVFLEMLLQNGCNSNACEITCGWGGGGRGWSPLHYACFFNHPRTVARLIKFGADPKLRDPNGVTPYDVSLWNGSVQCSALVCPENIEPPENSTYQPLTVSDVEDNAVDDSPVAPLHKELPNDTKIIPNYRTFRCQKPKRPFLRNPRYVLTVIPNWALHMPPLTPVQRQQLLLDPGLVKTTPGAPPLPPSPTPPLTPPPPPLSPVIPPAPVASPPTTAALPGHTSPPFCACSPPISPMSSPGVYPLPALGLQGKSASMLETRDGRLVTPRSVSQPNLASPPATRVPSPVLQLPGLPSTSPQISKKSLPGSVPGLVSSQTKLTMPLPGQVKSSNMESKLAAVRKLVVDTTTNLLANEIPAHRVRISDAPCAADIVPLAQFTKQIAQDMVEVKKLVEVYRPPLSPAQVVPPTTLDQLGRLKFVLLQMVDEIAKIVAGVQDVMGTVTKVPDIKLLVTAVEQLQKDFAARGATAPPAPNSPGMA